MRTKTLLGLTALAVSALTAVGAEVYSLNVVGYVNVAIPTGSQAAPSYTAIANPLSASPDNTVLTVLGASFPMNVDLLTWNGASFDVNSSYGAGSWDVPDQDISPGQGIFIKNYSGAPINITFVGEVLKGLQTNVVDKAYNFLGSKVPIQGNLDAAYAAGPPVVLAHNFTNVVANHNLLTWNGASWDINSYYGGGAWDVDPVIAVGQGFFYQQTGTPQNLKWISVGYP